MESSGCPPPRNKNPGYAGEEPEYCVAWRKRVSRVAPKGLNILWETGEGKSAVATPDGKSRKKKSMRIKKI